MPPTLVPTGIARRDRIRIGSPYEEPETVSFWCGRTHWQALADVVDALFDASGLRTSQTGAGGGVRAEIVKSGPHRTVTRLNTEAGTFYAKHNHSAGWRGWMRARLLPSKAFRELQAAERVKRLGIPTIEVVAIGEARSRTSASDTLVAREISDAQNLADFIERNAAQLSPSQIHHVRRELARRLGELVARLHRGRCLHADLIAENILARRHPDGTIQLWLIDLQELKSRGRVGLRDLQCSVTGLYNSLQWHITATDRLRFFRALWSSLTRPPARSQHSPDLPPGSARDIARRLEVHCRRAWRIATRHADKKWARGNRRLIIADAPGRRCRGLASLDPEWIDGVRDDPERLFRSARVLGADCRSENRRAAAIEIPATGGLVPCVVEADTPSAVGKSQWARAAWENGHQLLRRGILTPRPLMYVESPLGGYLVTERVRDAVVLSEWLEDELPALSQSARAKAIADCARALADAIRKLHSEGFEHDGLCASRMLLVTRGGRFCVALLDADRLRRRKLRRRIVCRQLAELHAAIVTHFQPSPALCLRLLKQYLGPSETANWKTIWQRVARKVSLQKRSGAGKATFLTALCCALFFAGCRTVDKPITLPARHSVRSDQLLVMSDFKLPKDHPLLADLEKLRRQVAETLELPEQTKEVVVYLFSTELAYTQYIDSAYPGLPHRRAYFVGTPHELAVYTYWGERIQEDLRHEYTHGLLHASIKNVPLWLDEGLAEYFEIPSEEPGPVNHEYTKRLGEALANGWRPDLKRLERINEFGQMQRIDYEESWAWIHFLLHSSPETRLLLHRYLADRRDNKEPEPLHVQLSREFTDYESRFLAYLQGLGSTSGLITRAG